MNICSFENFYMVNIRGNDVTNYSDLKWELLCEHQDKNSLSNQNYILIYTVWVVVILNLDPCMSGATNNNWHCMYLHLYIGSWSWSLNQMVRRRGLMGEGGEVSQGSFTVPPNKPLTLTISLTLSSWHLTSITIIDNITGYITELLSIFK